MTEYFLRQLLLFRSSSVLSLTPGFVIRQVRDNATLVLSRVLHTQSFHQHQDSYEESESLVTSVLVTTTQCCIKY